MPSNSSRYLQHMPELDSDAPGRKLNYPMRVSSLDCVRAEGGECLCLGERHDALELKGGWLSLADLFGHWGLREAAHHARLTQKNALEAQSVCLELVGIG